MDRGKSQYDWVCFGLGCIELIFYSYKKKKKDLWWNPIYVPSQKKKKKIISTLTQW